MRRCGLHRVGAAVMAATTAVVGVRAPAVDDRAHPLRCLSARSMASLPPSVMGARGAGRLGGGAGVWTSCDVAGRAATPAAMRHGARGYGTSSSSHDKCHGTRHDDKERGKNEEEGDAEDVCVKASGSAAFEKASGKMDMGSPSAENDSADVDGEEDDDPFYDSHRDRDAGAAADGAASMRPQTAPSLRTAYPPSGIELPESSFLKCIEKEMEDEKLRLDKEEGPPPPPTGWEMHHVKGSSVFYGRRLWLPPATSPVLSPSRPADAAQQRQDSDADNDDSLPRRTRFPERHERCMEKHFIRVQLTTRDAALDPECDIRGEHFPFSFFIQRVPLGANGRSADEGTGSSSSGSSARGSSLATIHAPTFDEAEELSMYENSIEVRLDVVDGELVVDAVVYHGEREVLTQANKKKLTPAGKPTGAGSRRGLEDDEEGRGTEDKADVNPLCNEKTHRTTGLMAQKGDKIAMYNNVFGGFPGPNLDEVEEEILDGIQSWLAERQIDDRFGEFIGQYSVWVEQMEYEAWLQLLHDYVAA